MKKLYDKNETLFAVLWILAYCLVLAPIRERFGDDSPWMTLALFAFAAGITVFVKSNHLEKKCGVDGWSSHSKACLYFIPMWILATGNLWFGFSPAYRGLGLAAAILSMILVGYVEEMIFRGFLFNAMLAGSKTGTAIIVSALTFGIGHIVNLFSGQNIPETLLQIVFAVGWGFILTMVYYKGGSLLPCIAAHAMIDVFSLFAAENEAGDKVYIIVTVAVAAAYCVYLARIRKQPVPQ